VHAPPAERGRHRRAHASKETEAAFDLLFGDRGEAESSPRLQPLWVRLGRPKLSSLVVDLQVESAQLRKGLDEATAKIDSFASHLESGVKSKMVSAIQEAVVSLDLLKAARTSPSTP
jgi:hypothetical protein